MKRSRSLFLALASVLVAEALLTAARPRYGGTLRVEMSTTVNALEPSAAAADPVQAAARARLLPLVFETLIQVDADGKLQPLLATSWQSMDSSPRWQLRLRPGVILHDGSRLEPWQVASALRAIEPRWRIANDADVLVIETVAPMPALPWVLATSPYAIAVRNSAGKVVGTGPFVVDRIEPALISLRAHQDHRSGRPFVDGVQVRLGVPLAAQFADLEAGRADVISIQATDVRRVADRQFRVAASRPLELVALVFEPHRTGDAFAAVRRALTSAIDRETIATTLLQDHASPADSLLPSWLAPRAPEAPRSLQDSGARNAIAALPPAQRELTIRVEPGDPVASLIAERVGVNARSLGLTVKVQAPTGLAPRPDIRLVRVRVDPDSPERALAAVVARLGPRAADPASAEVIPIVHLEELYATSEDVLSWMSKPVLGSGAWNFADAWIRGPRP